MCRLSYILGGLLALSASTSYAQTAPWVGNNLKGYPCSGGGQGYGPFDYRLRHTNPENLVIVEKTHFTHDVEALIRGNTSTTPGKDLDYTLRAWPNHHRALVSVMRYSYKKGAELRTPPECYLQRAINYSPKDGIASMMYAIFLHKSGHTKESLGQYQKALKQLPHSAEIHYNYGLLLVSLKKYDDAKKHAQKAYKLGYPFPGLRNKLAALGYWQDDSAR